MDIKIKQFVKNISLVGLGVLLAWGGKTALNNIEGNVDIAGKKFETIVEERDYLVNQLNDIADQWDLLVDEISKYSSNVTSEMDKAHADVEQTDKSIYETLKGLKLPTQELSTKIDRTHIQLKTYNWNDLNQNQPIEN